MGGCILEPSPSGMQQNIPRTLQRKFFLMASWQVFKEIINKKSKYQDRKYFKYLSICILKDVYETTEYNVHILVFNIHLNCFIYNFIIWYI